jgi:DNA-binding CsgD family transcriptional regulator
MTHAPIEESNSEDLEPSSRMPLRGPLVLFSAISVLVLVDVVHDATLGAELSHLLIEGVLMACGIAGAVVFWRFWRAERKRAREALEAAGHEVRRWQAEADRWRSEHRSTLEGLGAAIDIQFERWRLSGAEREVALLVLKGLSHREVAGVRGTSERTCRQQARSVYQKAGLSGRAELSAFFLEDLLAPVVEGP